MDLELTTQLPAPTPDAEDSKVARFRAALERKNYTLYPGAGPGDFWTFCPGHESSGPHEPSLHVSVMREGTDTEDITTYCFGCNDSFYLDLMRGDAVECTATYVVKPQNRLGKVHGYGAVITAWEIHTEDDEHKYSRQCELEGRGGLYVAGFWDYNNGDFKKVKWSNGEYVWLRKSEWREGAYLAGLNGRNDEVWLYGAQRVNDTVDTVWMVEGEKDVETLWGMGLVGVSYHTVGNRTEKYGCLEGKNIVVLGDNDRHGTDLVLRVSEEIQQHGMARTLTVVGEFDGVSGYDVSDWVRDGGTRGALEGLAAAAVTEILAPPITKEIEVESEIVEPKVLTERERKIVRDAQKHADHLEATEMGRLLFNELRSKKGTRLDVEILLSAERPRPSVGALEGGNQHLFYAGTYNGVFGATGHGKSWLGLVCMAQEMLAGNHVVFFTYELPGVVVVDRLRTLGVRDDVMVTHLHLFDDKTTVGVDALAEVMASTGGTAPTFVLMDSVRELLGARGVNGYQETDISQYVIVGMSDPFTRLGAAFVSIDHVGHENHDRQSGSAAKNAVVQGALYAVNEDQSIPFRAGNRGYVGFELKKDNLSGLPWDRNKVCFYLNVDVVMDGGMHGVTSVFTLAENHLSMSALEKATATTDMKPDAAIEMQEKILSVVQEQPGIKQDDLAKSTGKNLANAKAMIRQMVSNGLLRVERHNNAHLHFLPNLPTWGGESTGTDGGADGHPDWPV
jgi:hypothetical protein